MSFFRVNTDGKMFRFDTESGKWEDAEMTLLYIARTSPNRRVFTQEIFEKLEQNKIVDFKGEAKDNSYVSLRNGKNLTIWQMRVHKSNGYFVTMLDTISSLVLVKTNERN